MARIREMSRCPHCGARGVKLLEPLIKDGYNTDQPYCGACGKNWPMPPDEPNEPRDNVTRIDR